MDKLFIIPTSLNKPVKMVFVKGPEISSEEAALKLIELINSVKIKEDNNATI